MSSPVSPFSFHLPTRLEVGRGVSRKAGAEARRFGTRALVVTGARSLAASGRRAELVEELARENVAATFFTVEGEPDTIRADEAARAARGAKVDVVLAFGGGSAIDVAKVAAALACNDGVAEDYLEGLPAGGGRSLVSSSLPLVCVPTTAGTGSEVTKNAVLQVPAYRLKRSMRSESMFPAVALIDPDLSGGAPRPVRAATGFDALTHLVEAFCSPKASAMTDALAVDGIARAIDGLRALAADEGSSDAAYDLALAAALGGIALSFAGLGAAHGIVSPLGGLYPNVPHGAALACLLPATLAVNAELAELRGVAVPKLAHVAELIAGEGASMRDALGILLDVRRRGGLPPLRDYASFDLDAIVRSPSGSVKTNPLLLGPDDLRRIMTIALGET